MTADDRKFLSRINKYKANQKVQMPAQLLDKLRPIMEEIASEQGVSVEDVLVRYMDLQSEAALLSNNTVLKGIDGIGPDGNPFLFN